jgi:tripartite-type tricarboxylate transporter receptor subunit TctC
MLFASIPSVIGHIKSGSVRPLVVTAATRAPELPEVPTMQELGFKDFDVRAWDAILVPAGTPQEIISRLNREIAKVAATPEVQEGFKKVGLHLSVSSPQALDARIKRETALWAPVIKEAGIRVE